jgi:hypothetical protein
VTEGEFADNCLASPYIEIKVFKDELHECIEVKRRPVPVSGMMDHSR